MRPFYRGENVDLLTPTLEHVEKSSWADWFNSQQTTRNTSHAIFPNSLDDQRAFYNNMRATGRLALLIARSGESEPIGVISLSGVDFRQGTAGIAIVMDTESSLSAPSLASLEAMALLTAHAFDVMGLNRIEAGQTYPTLRRWSRLLEVIGYRAEGIKRGGFTRGHSRSDVVMIACLYQDYQRIVEARGSIWPGNAVVHELISQLPARSFTDLVDERLVELRRDYFGETD